ncbi:hypothetical protein J5J83_05180 [Azoarcus sp. L1K30]|uniref:hypothetical protein n=1 Tax=Azoarcus sp. L1K30 TaxID=2820277 RepID=UPI001B8262C3|nr:hypothetical protein [Azoarcus sp. L1K30]MBR0565510.1 hypothetical protein [Azoarcus sp. L1K30]
MTKNERLRAQCHKPALERSDDELHEPFKAFISAQTTASRFLVAALVAAVGASVLLRGGPQER